MHSYGCNIQGGLGEGYKRYIAEEEIPDETYKEDGVALFRVQGSGPDNMQAIQVETVCHVFSFYFFNLQKNVCHVCCTELTACHVLVIC